MLSFLKSKSQKKTTAQNLKDYDSMLDVSNVLLGYDYWKSILEMKIVRMFDIKGLPPTIPAQEIEKLTLFEGKAGFIKDPVYGYVAVPCSLYGVGLYPSYPPFMLWATPRVEGEGILNRDCCVIRNNSKMKPVNDTIKRYARLLADTESTLSAALCLVRQPSMASAPDEETANSYKAANLAMRLGQTDVAIDSDILNAMTRDKKAPMTTDEVQADNQMLVISVEDMISARVESYSAVNRTFPDLHITVELSEKFKPVSNNKAIAFNEVYDKNINAGRGAE